jgi:hypothetical protein
MPESGPLGHTRTMTMEELLALPVVMGLKTAARALGIGQNRAYRMARAGGALSSSATITPCQVKPDGREFKVTRFDLFASMGLDPVTGARVQDAA